MSQATDNFVNSHRERFLEALKELIRIPSISTSPENSDDVKRAAQFVADQGLTAPTKGSGTLTVGAANFSENITVAEIYGAVLRDAGYDVTVRPIGNRETYMPALESGEVNVVPEYAATAAEFLNKKLNGDTAPAVAVSVVPVA